jgi:two-component system chemotaxis sensor kinase CheA
LSGGPTLASDATEQAAARRILVVDDSLTTRTLEKSILEAAGYEVEVAVDGADALGRLGQRDFDLVLSDVQMPRLDGVSLVRAVKQDSRLNKIPIVLVSSLDAEEHRRQGLDAGADAYLSKAEFEQGLLLSTLDRFI